MNLKHILIVFKKEMKDCFRDKKSVISNILLPLVLIPAMYFIMNMFMQSSTKEVEDNMKVGIVYNQNIDQAYNFTKDRLIGDLKAEIIKYDSEQAATDSLLNGDIKCAIIYPADFISNIEKGTISNIKLKYDSTRNSSVTGYQIINSKLIVLNSTLSVEKLQALNIPTDILSLVSVNTEDAYIKTPTEDGSSAMKEVLVMILPMYLAIVIVTAGMPLALDLFAGERERNTFEALFSTKANRFSILIGKYISVLVFSILSIFTSFIGIIIGMGISPDMFGAGQEKFSIMSALAAINIPVGAFILVLLSAITLAMVFGGIQIAISTYSKTLKGAQTYLSYISLVGMIPGFISMSMGAGDMKGYMAFIPIFNTISSIKTTLTGIVDYPTLIIGVITNIVFSIIVSVIVVKMFNDEKVIIK